MKQGKINRLVCMVCILILLLPMLPSKQVQALETLDVKMHYDGSFEFTTTDTAATTNITWETIGFTVRREPVADGNPRKDNNFAELRLIPGQKTGDGEVIGGKKYITFYLTKEQVNDALKDTPLHNIKTNDELYLNGIFRVHNGTKKQTVYYTYDGIYNAEDWIDKSNFAPRFNRRIIYNGGNQEYPVEINYQLYKSGKYYQVEKKDYEKGKKYKTHDEIKLTWNQIPAKRMEDGQEFYLYRVYYKNLTNNKILGNRKLTTNPNIDYDGYLKELEYIRNRTLYVQAAKDGDSLQIYAIYRRFPVKSNNEDSEEIIKEYEETDPTAVIGADKRGNEAYEVTEGIPGTESLYTNVFTSKYLAGSTFTKKYGKKIYNVNVKKTYNLRWSEEDPKTGKPIDKQSTRTMTYRYPIERKYSYWIISSLGVYGINNAVVKNEAFPGGSVTLSPNGYNLPTVSYNHSNNESDHITEPKIKEIIIPSETIDGGNAEPSIPSEEFKAEADKSVAKIKCKNDSLIFNGETIMSPAVKEEKTDNPKEIPSGLDEIGENVLFKSNIVIPGTKANGNYESMATVTYKPIIELNPDEVETTYEVDYVNNVVVHTPTVCDAQIENKYRDNQMINPDKARASLVLDRPFYVNLPTTGTHRFIKGYQYRDYGKYIADREVKFPFDVYRGSSVNGTFVPKNTWTSIGEDTQFYLPTWVTEGKYTIDFRSTAINAYANSGMNKTETLANLQLNNYVATDTVDIEVSGRIYGLYLYDITDYPMWENVFRSTGSLKLNGFKYTVGDKDQNGNSNGQNKKYTLTLVNGSHPEIKNLGVIKTGYVTRFSLKTVGTMYGKNDYIRIKPTFYYVDSKGKNRQEVDIYYTESFNGKKNVMVKMGGSLDLKNKKSVYTGDEYLSIPEKELKQTAYFQGVPLKQWKAQKKNIFTFKNIMIPPSLRTFVGYVKNVPSTVTEKMIAQSVQNWYGEYYIPAEVHVAPKDYDILEYVKYNGPLNYKEKFWLKNGYIVVNFEIETVKDGKRHLSYINTDNATEGYCNMWKREGYQYEKTDFKDITFNFQDGDYIMYYTDKSVNDDYISAGTH